MTFAASFWGGTESTGYKVLLVLHIVMIAVAFGSVIAQSEVSRKIKGGSRDAAELGVRLTTRYTLPALIVAVAAGVAMVIRSGDTWGFDETWISASFSTVLALIVIAWFLLLPTQRALVHVAEIGVADEPARNKLVAKLSMSTGLFQLGFLLIVVLMIWKPGA